MRPFCVIVNIEESTLTESTALLTSAQAAARLGVKPATLYAYVSRGLLVRHPSPDGRRSLFDPADLDRLERRSAGRHGAPSDVIVGSELALVDPAERSLWYRGIDALQLAREQTFEDVCALLWASRSSDPWHADAATSRVAAKSQTGLGRGVSPVDRLSVCASAITATHLRTGPRELMACLVDVLPAAQASGDDRFAVRLWTKLTPRRRDRRMDPRPRRNAFAALRAAPHERVARRARRRAGRSPARVERRVGDLRDGRPDRCVRGDRVGTREGGVGRVDARGRRARSRRVDGGLLARSVPHGRPANERPARRSSPTSRPTRSPSRNALSDELRRRGADHPTASYAAAVLAWAGGMRPGSGAVIARLANIAGWIAHALEEYRLPTPYRPRLAYTGPAPQSGTATAPRRTIDAVLSYLERE